MSEGKFKFMFLKERKRVGEMEGGVVGEVEEEEREGKGLEVEGMVGEGEDSGDLGVDFE